MEDLINSIRSIKGCRTLPPQGEPAIEPGHRLPADLSAFYQLCGGVELFTRSLYPVSISPPGDLAPSNAVILGERFDDISDSWYIIGRGGGDEYISIDLAPSRIGRCYDSFSEVHGVAGSSPIIAQSFTELLERLIAARGGHWYWLEPEFRPIGDAYDDAP